MPQQGGLNAPYTRFRGPVLVGQSSDFGVAAVNGGSTAPLISFWNASEFGFYVTSTAQVDFAVPGGSIMTFTSSGMVMPAAAGGSQALAVNAAGVRLGTTALMTTANSDTLPHAIIPVTTGILSSGDLPTSLGGGAALVWAISTGNVNHGKLWVYTTVSTGWMASTTPFFTSTST